MTLFSPSIHLSISLVAMLVLSACEPAPAPPAAEPPPAAIEKKEEPKEPAKKEPSKPAPKLTQPPKPVPKPQPLVEVRDRFSEARVIAEMEVPAPTQPRLKWQAQRLIEAASSATPLLRVVEEWRVDAGKALRVKQTAMAADQVIVKLTPKARIDALLQRFADLRPQLRKHLPASGLYVVGIDDATLTTVPDLIARLNRERDLVQLVEPDWVLR